MSDTLTMVESVARFRSRAQTVFHDWAFAWLRHTVDSRITRDRATILAAVIQVLYWSVLNRNPTVAEWASDVVRYGQFPLLPNFIRQDLQYKKNQPDGRAESELNMLKPYWNLYQLAGDEGTALRDYARQVGMAFLSHKLRVESLPVDLDWSDAEATIGRVMNPPPKKKWWHRVLTFAGK